MVVGTSTAACFPAITTWNAARIATSVLPYPTSPQTSRSIGRGEERSDSTSRITCSWSGVSSWGNAASNSRKTASGGETGAFSASWRFACRSTSSWAIASRSSRTFRLARCHAVPPRRDSCARPSSDATYRCTLDIFSTGTNSRSPPAYSRTR